MTGEIPLRVDIISEIVFKIYDTPCKVLDVQTFDISVSETLQTTLLSVSIIHVVLYSSPFH